MGEPTDLHTHAGQAPSGDDAGNGRHQKRTRVLLSCAPCRASKLKCDRDVPCGNCLKKGRVDLCTYSPRPKKPEKQANSMASRLRRLEGMLREIIADDGSAAMSSFGQAGGPDAAAPVTLEQKLAAEGITLAPVAPEAAAEGAGGPSIDSSLPPGSSSRLGTGRLVMGERSTTYVGATHFMAMLDDIEDLKSYFENTQEGGTLPEEEPDEPLDEDGSPASVTLGTQRVRSKLDLLAVMPPRSVVDRLIVCYFGSNTPSIHTVHRPTFSKQYSAFWQDPSRAEVDWLGVLYGIMALGVHFSSLSADGARELLPSPPTLAEQFRLYRSATSWALTTSRLASPSLRTIQALLMFGEAEFLVNRASQTHCWLLSATCIRLMLNMGMHRDPSKLPNMSAFEGEMRRRMWNLAIQLDLIVSFHMGLPSMIHGIPSDTSLPHNLLDEDFDEGCAALPPPRPYAEYTCMSYPIFKSMVCRVFGQVARLSHTLTPPSYAEVMRTDALLLDKWRQIPDFMKVRPLADAVFDPPSQVVQRFGLASLFQKSRCVLHRPYLAVAVPRPEHAYSRRTCLQAALELLGYHEAIAQATEPGGILSHIGWFVTGLGMHDFLLAAMIVYLVVQNEALFEDELITSSGSSISPPVGGTTGSTGLNTATSSGSSGSGFSGLTTDSGGLPGNGNSPQSVGTPASLPVARSTLVALLLRSYRLWASLATNHYEVQKSAELLRIMVSKIEARDRRENGVGNGYDSQAQPTGPLAEAALNSSSTWQTSADMPSMSNMSLNSEATNLLPSASYDTSFNLSTPVLVQDSMQTNFSRRDLIPNLLTAAGNAGDTSDVRDAATAPGVYDSWMAMPLEAFDWDTIDNGIRVSSSQTTDWIDQSTVDDISTISTGLWDHPDGVL